MTELERRIKAKIPGPDTGIEVRHTMCDICSPGMHCGINAYIKDGRLRALTAIRPMTGASVPREWPTANTYTGKTGSRRL